jgi:hypothetical protein
VPNKKKIGKVAWLPNYHVGVGCFQDSRIRRTNYFIFSKGVRKLKLFPPAMPL